MAKKKECKPGRWRKVCTGCQGGFSTHSSDREKCHKCLPKCREVHVFNRGTPVMVEPKGQKVRVKA